MSGEEMGTDSDSGSGSDGAGSSYDQIGFRGIEDEAAVIALNERVFGQTRVVRQISDPGLEYREFIDESGAALDIVLLHGREFYGIFPALNTERVVTFDWEESIAVEGTHYGFVAGAVNENRFAAELIDFAALPETVRPLKLRIYGFVNGIQTRGEVEAQFQSGLTVSDEFHLFYADFDDDDRPNHAIVACTVREISPRKNTVTGERFFIISGDTAWGRVDFAWAEEPRVAKVGEVCVLDVVMVGKLARG